ncbi:efflux RND transporter periplasmic adaptor subunit [Ferrimonas aestuarii]|uniref:Efflux RND transporter periplasmic adaptor subunit n=1 Tax=Ferrimonas aestuarii TaxID=2569539 RepID=A0A4U1BNF7_9GAMM|nr:efflux RND transporter periplasmic adaptor subunit [Ferrimonas aestuarii]TKB54673.1 efflux RND transporter periplasmic adaptor subunit [Ferrimonas aestuarii]
MTHSAIIPTLFLASLLMGCQPEVTSKAESPVAQVQSVTLSMQDSYPITHKFVGRIFHPQTSDLGFEPSGTVEQINVELGQRVDTGQTLARLDIRLLQSESRQLQASLAQIQADLDLVNTTLKRQLSLSKQGYQSEQQLDELRSQKAQLTAQSQQLTANLDANAIRLQKSELKAPYSGVVIKRHINEGQVTGAGQPAFTLVPEGAVEARIGLPVRLLSKLDPNSSWRANVDGEPLSLNYLGQSAEVDASTRTVTLRFAVAPDKRLLNGQLIYLEVEEQIASRNAKVPLSALTAGLRGLWSLYVLERLDNGDFQVERRDVRVLHANDSEAWVSGAIVDDDSVVATGLQRLVAGQRVQIEANQSQLDTAGLESTQL